jgi:hypothetical protein
MEILPPRPLRLSGSFVIGCWLKAAAFFAVGAAILVAVSVWQGGEVKHILADADIWDHGEVAIDHNVSGKERSQNFIANSYDLKVQYVDQEGTAHSGKLEFMLLFRSVDQKSEAEVRYDRNDHSKFALAWAVDRSGSRWLGVIFMWGILALVGGFVGWLGVLQVRNWLEARACAAESRELAAHLISVSEVRNQKGKPTGARNYFYRYTLPDGRELQGQVRYAGAHQPLWADSSRRTLVVLIASARPQRPLPVRGDLHPFAFSSEEAQKIRQRAESAPPAASANVPQQS